ncbi:MAG: FAD-linked oxidase C-terminal domain-containing protein, partial [Pseudomonadota bacterium]
SSGYNVKDAFSGENVDLNKLLVGSEGTLCVITKIRFKLTKIPTKRITLLSLFDDFEKSLQAVNIVKDVKGLSAIELLDEELINVSKAHFTELKDFFATGTKAGLLFEIDAPVDSVSADNFVEAQARELESRLSNLSLRTELGRNEEKRKWLWRMRKSANSVLNRIHGSVQSLRFIDDVAVPVDSILDFYRQEKKILDKYGLKTAFFGHIGAGNFHINPKVDTRSKDFVKTIEAVCEETYTLVKKLNGTFAAEHGDGILREPYIKKLNPELYSLFSEIKNIFDPKNILNAKKDIKLRYAFTPICNVGKQVLDAVERCHGCNECIDFCSAYIDKNCTNEGYKARGRANIMRSLLNGNIKGDEIEPAIKYIEACRLCGKCLTECPTGVDLLETAALLREVKILPISLKNRLLMLTFAPLRNILIKKIRKAAAGSTIDLDIFKQVIKLGLYYLPYTRGIMNEAKNKKLGLKISDENIQKYLTARHT